MTLAVAIGNLDLHAKNLALLHGPDGSSALAPAYDMMPLAHRPGADGRLAMAVGGEYALAAVTREHLEAEVRSWGADGAYVGLALERLVAAVDGEEPAAPAEKVRGRIATALDRLLAGGAIGDAFAS